jgi:demethylmenaquinone methyltransferase/2-methoxy-6-polyprenyl-1,4-benzoquinol methylase
MTKLKTIPKDSLTDAGKKKVYNKTLFKIVAPSYQIITRVMSLNRDSYWKKVLLSWLNIKSSDTIIVDIASGTGDILYLIKERYPDVYVIASDLSLEMYFHRPAKLKKHKIPSICNDMSCMPVKSNTCDIVTGGYALRNAPDISKAISEVYRILKPGGRALFLDFSHSSNKFVSVFQHHILSFWGSLLGMLFHGNPAVYNYIAKSLSTFPDTTKIRELFAEKKLPVIKQRTLMFGLIALIECEKKI